MHFSSSGCVIQEREIGRMIRIGSECEKLSSRHCAFWHALRVYYGGTFKKETRYSVSISLSRDGVGITWLFLCFSVGFSTKMWTTWHWRLGYLNNNKLVSLFETGHLYSSFIKTLPSFMQFKCESCSLRAMFSLSLSIRLVPLHCLI